MQTRRGLDSLRPGSPRDVEAATVRTLAILVTSAAVASARFTFWNQKLLRPLRGTLFDNFWTKNGLRPLRGAICKPKGPSPWGCCRWRSPQKIAPAGDLWSFVAAWHGLLQHSFQNVV